MGVGGGEGGMGQGGNPGGAIAGASSVGRVENPYLLSTSRVGRGRELGWQYFCITRPKKMALKVGARISLALQGSLNTRKDTVHINNK